jgi:hypothetical protein
VTSRDVDSYYSGLAPWITWYRQLPLWAGTPRDPVSRGFRRGRGLIDDAIRGRGLLATDPIATRPGIDVGRVAVAIGVVVVGRVLAKPPRLAGRRLGARPPGFFLLYILSPFYFLILFFNLSYNFTYYLYFYYFYILDFYISSLYPYFPFIILY